MSLALRIYRKIIRMSRVVLRFFIEFIPRNRCLVVYGGALDLFIDNAKHLFIYNNESESMSSFKHVWLSRNDKTLQEVRRLGFNAVKANSIYGIWTMLRAGFIIFDNQIKEFSNYDFSQGAVRIELWHGLPLKMWGAIKNDNQPFYERKSQLYERYIHVHYLGDYCVSTAKSLDRYFSAAFCIPKENLIHSSYPRNRVMFMDEAKRVKYINKYESAEVKNTYFAIRNNHNKKVVYMPTFRDAKPHYLSEAIPDFDRLNDFCKENGVTVYLKVHRVTPLPEDILYSNIKVLDNSLDMYPLMPLFDMLITDYSSIMYDYALLEKPVVLYTYDILEYSIESRNIYNFFWRLKDQLTNVTDFTDFMCIMTKENNKICKFPYRQFYECPNDIDAINIKIKELSQL